MENYDFNTQEKIPVFFSYPIKPRKFIFSNILGNLLFSLFIINYILKFFTFQKSFDKYMILILELFNSIFTAFFILIYLRLLGFDTVEAKRILVFYFYYSIFYLVLFIFFISLFFSQIIQNEIFEDSITKWNIWEIIMIFSPLFVIFILRLTQHLNYYFAMKQIE